MHTDEFDLVTLGGDQLRALRHVLRAHRDAQRITIGTKGTRTSLLVEGSNGMTEYGMSAAGLFVSADAKFVYAVDDLAVPIPPAYLTAKARTNFNEELPVIEDRADLGCGVCVLGAVTVGHDAVIGANSVVVKDVPPHAVAVGVPARVIKVRMAPEAAAPSRCLSAV